MVVVHPHARFVHENAAAPIRVLLNVMPRESQAIFFLFLGQWESSCWREEAEIHLVSLSSDPFM
jgi:hypothetical protein